MRVASQMISSEVLEQRKQFLSSSAKWNLLRAQLKGIVRQFWIYNIFFMPQQKKHFL